MYLEELYVFTVEAFRVPSASFKFHASILTQVWQRILQESNSLTTTGQTKVSEFVESVITVYIEENIKQEELQSQGPNGLGGADDNAGEDEDENF